MVSCNFCNHPLMPANTTGGRTTVRPMLIVQQRVKVRCQRRRTRERQAYANIVGRRSLSRGGAAAAKSLPKPVVPQAPATVRGVPGRVVRPDRVQLVDGAGRRRARRRRWRYDHLLLG